MNCADVEIVGADTKSFSGPEMTILNYNGKDTLANQKSISNGKDIYDNAKIIEINVESDASIVKRHYKEGEEDCEEEGSSGKKAKDGSGGSGSSGSDSDSGKKGKGGSGGDDTSSGSDSGGEDDCETDSDTEGGGQNYQGQNNQGQYYQGQNNQGQYYQGQNNQDSNRDASSNNQVTNNSDKTTEKYYYYYGNGQGNQGNQGNGQGFYGQGGAGFNGNNQGQNQYQPGFNGGGFQASAGYNSVSNAPAMTQSFASVAYATQTQIADIAITETIQSVAYATTTVVSDYTYELQPMYTSVAPAAKVFYEGSSVASVTSEAIIANDAAVVQGKVLEGDVVTLPTRTTV
ncbi:hypothetical protein GGH12_004440 [Coemansia sp. RSA 1822]|nr:hypothetical protein GGH12_004440 [Coemansia sp. RSA 1822]